MVTRTHDAAPKLNSIVELMSSDFRAEVVQRALAWRKKASGDLRQSFQSVLRKNVRIKGFRNPNRADNQLLLIEILRLLPSSAELVGALLQVWMNSHAELYEIVCRRLSELRMPAHGLDYSENRFAGIWDFDNWLQERESLAASHSQFSEDDVALMLCCVSGNMPDRDEGDNDDPAESRGDAFFRQWLEELRELPADASQWQQANDFVASATEIIQYKTKVRGYIQQFNEIMAEMKQEFGRELAFFQCGPDSWSVEQLSDRLAGDLLPAPEEVEELLRKTESLKFLLTDYSSVHDIAPTIEEEAVLWPRRVELQRDILTCLYQMHRPFWDSDEDEDTPAVEASVSDTSAVEDDESDSTQPSMDGRSDESVHEPSAETPFSSDTGNASLASENSSLRLELQELRGEMKTTEELVKLWRVAYEETRKQVAPTEKPPSEDELLPIEDVRTAVALAREKYSGELLFQPNSKSEIEDNPFEKPTNVLAALEWLATTYYRSKMGEVSVPDLNSSIKKACGWRYIGSQSKNTMNRYKPWYTTGLEGKTFWLKSHVGTGSNKDSRYTIRIAFDWDSARQVVVIGYIGQHQQTDAT